MGSRFCSCDVSDGTSSFVCEKCKKIKKTSKKVVKRAIKKSKREKQNRMHRQQLQSLQVEDQDGAGSTDSPKQYRDAPLSPGKRKNMLQEVIDLRMFQEMALRKVFRDYDVDKNGTMNAHEIRDDPKASND